MKKILFIIFLYLIFPLPTVYAQQITSNSVVTKVGTPKEPPPDINVKNTNFVYYCQGNPQWGKVCDLANYGCGPTSFAMALSSFGINKDPLQVDQEFRQNNFRSCGGLSDPVQVAYSSWFASQGMIAAKDDLADNGALDYARAKKYIDSGWLIIGLSLNYTCAAGCNSIGHIQISHIFVIDAVDTTNNSIEIRDPSNCFFKGGNDEDTSNTISPPLGGNFRFDHAIAVKKG